MNRLIPLLLALPGLALAQGASPLALNLTQSLIQTVQEGGKATEKRTPGYTRVRPGDLLAQNVTARNVSARTLANVAVKLPVPAGHVYVSPDGTAATGVRTEYSIDGGKTFAPAPLKKKVTVTENGKAVTKEIEVKPNEYDAVRWTIATLPAGTEKTLGFRVQVK
ncbi:hypothetical protein SAMN04488058_10836 [Deinococcus reticulitermitis]|uniref:Uncharacterized protein n=1 Tax=Deinococcus reticulitermitis TaxID=856736 RepID=A0A1H6YUM9_9DEIO|nr:DUF11 domain-containing protein [Deinococcus reticulitermitis]SEJ44026.1 hypothetical protein SAMN04488058_10836 [Deinococcus reticulitermitis]